MEGFNSDGTDKLGKHQDNHEPEELGVDKYFCWQCDNSFNKFSEAEKQDADSKKKSNAPW